MSTAHLLPRPLRNLLKISCSACASRELVGSSSTITLASLKKALASAILGFTEDTGFNVIYFNSKVKPWRRGLVPAGPGKMVLACRSGLVWLVGDK